jgi:hypothetical protein
MKLCGNGPSYSKSKFSLNEGYEILQQETVHLLEGLKNKAIPVTGRGGL